MAQQAQKRPLGHAEQPEQNLLMGSGADRQNTGQAHDQAEENTFQNAHGRTSR